MDIIGGISAATEGLKLINELRKIDKELDKAELKLRLVDVVDKILDSKQALQDAQEREHSLRKQIFDLQSKLDEVGRCEDFDGLLFKLDENKRRNGEPFCNQCYVKEARLFRLIYGPYAGGGYRCSNCDGIFGKRDKLKSGGIDTFYDPLDHYE